MLSIGSFARLGEIPGARGCSQEACSFRDNLADLQATGVAQVLALSSDRGQYQQELAARLHLPYRLLSDPDLQVADSLGLPTSTAQAVPRVTGEPQRLYTRLTLVLRGAVIEHVFYPVFPLTSTPRKSSTGSAPTRTRSGDHVRGWLGGKRAFSTAVAGVIATAARVGDITSPRRR